MRKSDVIHSRSILGSTAAALVLAACCSGTAAEAPLAIDAKRPVTIEFAPVQARFVRLVIHASAGGDACIDELEVYGAEGKNLASAEEGAKAAASSCIAGYPIHQVANLNDGRYGNSHSWIPAGPGPQWAEIELPRTAEVAKVVFSRDREGKYDDRLLSHFEVRISTDGKQWQTVREVKTTALVASPPAVAPPRAPIALPEPLTWEGLLRYALLCERDSWQRISRDDRLSPFRVKRSAEPDGPPYWDGLVRLDSLDRVLRQMDDMIARFRVKGIDVSQEQAELAQLRRRQDEARKTKIDDPKVLDAIYFDARLAKRRLMFRDPALAALEKVLFVKRHPYTPSHNYSDNLDSAFRPGGGVFLLELPRRDGRLDPAQGSVRMLADSSTGIARDGAASFDAQQIYFAYRASDKGPENAYWRLMVMRADGSDLKQLTSGPFNDYYPCPLPDGGVAFISTRCRCRFLCWRPQAFVLFRMDANGSNIQPLSFANLSEWAPSVMRDGRILWTRSEYLDKGADFGHTLWAIHPDGSHPLLLFGNDTPNCYVNAREMPGTGELCCTLISHGGDLNGPIGLVDIRKGPFHGEAITNITPDSTPQYHMSWAARECFRDPVPLTRDYILVSHAPADRFGLYVIDRYGNREILYLDPTIGSMCPTVLQPAPTPPVLNTGLQVVSGKSKATASAPPAAEPPAAEPQEGLLTVSDVYRGLEPAVGRGRVKYLRVCEEVRSPVDPLPDGSYRKDYDPFQDFYAAPTHKLTGPSGWPSYVAKASLGIVPVEEDGSASFRVPAGRVLYFEALDENLNEIQRMRSVVQMQPGERRTCVGCHEHRTLAPPIRPSLALRGEPRTLEPPTWGAVPFSYEKVVQPVWNSRCVSCHDARDKQAINLSGTLDGDRIPASYRTLISQGWVHYFDYTWGREHEKAEPLTFGTLKSRLGKVLDEEHHGVKLNRDEMHRVKCWIDLNCPLWPDYQFRMDRSSPLAGR